MNESNDRAHALSIGVALARRPLAESGLSRRELEVIGLVSEGLTNSEIAKKLFISVATVKVHLNHIYDKLGVRTRTEAALRAATGFTGEMEEI
jgi:DNA-binding NarL/FixJ family response regulator